MTNFAAQAPLALSGKHNMASDAFQALRTARAEGRVDANQVSFADLIDTVNPLQHIPVVSTLYRDLTGDTISSQARIAGGALYGGPIGFVASMIDSVVNTVTGDDLGGHLLATLFGSDDKPESTQIASSTPPAPQSDAELVTASLAPSPALGATQSLPERLSASAGAAALPKSATPPKPLPELSPEAFGALLNSFADPKAARDANADLAAKLTLEEPGKNTPATDAAVLTAQAASAPLPKASPAPVPASTARPANAPVNLMGAMQSSLDKLEALKAANAKSLSLNAAVGTDF